VVIKSCGKLKFDRRCSLVLVAQIQNQSLQSIPTSSVKDFSWSIREGNTIPAFEQSKNHIGGWIEVRSSFKENGTYFWVIISKHRIFLGWFRTDHIKYDETKFEQKLCFYNST
jgi:hypothetical protein